MALKRPKLVLASLIALIVFVGAYLVSQTLSIQKAPSKETEEVQEPLSPIGPKEATGDFYRWYLDCLEEHFQSQTGRSPMEDCPPEYGGYLSTEFLEGIKSLVSYDPILCAQDTPTDFRVGDAVVDRRDAMLNVETFFGDYSHPRSLKINLAIQGDRWIITNITCP